MRSCLHILASVFVIVFSYPVFGGGEPTLISYKSSTVLSESNCDMSHAPTKALINSANRRDPSWHVLPLCRLPSCSDECRWVIEDIPPGNTIQLQVGSLESTPSGIRWQTTSFKDAHIVELSSELYNTEEATIVGKGLPDERGGSLFYETTNPGDRNRFDSGRFPFLAPRDGRIALSIRCRPGSAPEPSTPKDLIVLFLPIFPGGSPNPTNDSEFRKEVEHGAFRQQRTRIDILEKNSPENVGWAKLGEITAQEGLRHRFVVTTSLPYPQVLEIGLTKEWLSQIQAAEAQDHRGSLLGMLCGIKKLHVFVTNEADVVLINDTFSIDEWNVVGAYNQTHQGIAGFSRPDGEGPWSLFPNTSSGTAFVPETGTHTYRIEITVVDGVTEKDRISEIRDIPIILRTW